jgi:hypothetical protein
MDDVPITARDEASQLLNRLLGRYDVPAYIRRAQRVQAAFDQLVQRCQQQRDEWLRMVRTRLGQVHALAGDWERLRPLLAEPEQIHALEQLHAALAPRLRLPVVRTASTRVLRRALSELQESMERFNHKWQAYLATVDLTDVNALREGYNRYYLLEKECAVRSTRIARQGYQPLAAVTHGDLATLIPALPMMRLKERFPRPPAAGRGQKASGPGRD